MQWVTPHLASLGAVTVPRCDYLTALRGAVPLTPTLLGGGEVLE